MKNLDIVKDKWK